MHPRNFTDFDDWVKKVELIQPKFEAICKKAYDANQKYLNEVLTPVDNMKFELTRMTDCILNDDCRSRFMAHVAERAKQGIAYYE